MNYQQGIVAFAGLLNDAAASTAGLTQVGNMQFYRNNCRLNRINALANTFTTVAELTGSEFFAAMARQYVDATPAASANLHAMGADFADFVAEFAPAAALPYLADVARLDWAVWCAFLADDENALPATVLQGLDEAALGALQLRFAPALQLVQSAQWPIADILSMHQGGAPARIDAGGQCVVVWGRHWFQVETARLVFYRALAAGRTVLDALGEADDLRAGEWLGWLFAQGVITGLAQSEGVVA